MFTFVVILVLGVLSRQYLGRALRLPYTVILMVLGALTGLLIENRRNAFELNLKSWYDMTPQVILYCFVPILVFESAFMTDTHIFSRQKWQILTLAGPGVLVASILTGGFVKAVFTDYGWDWPTVLMFGAMMSATDPVAVVALLKELGVSERLGTLIEGESLLNDGTAIVVFDVFKHALEHKPCDAEMPSWQSVLRMLFRLGALGPVVGTRDALSMDVEDTPSSSSTALGRREVHAVCIVGIAAKESRAVRLSPGAKAFVLSDALLRAHVAGSGAASPVRSSVSVPVSAAALHQLHQRGKGLGPNTYAWLAKTLPSKGARPLTPASTAPTQSFQMTESTNSTGGFPIESTGGSLDIGDSADAQPVDHMAVLVDDDGEDSGAEDDAAPAAEEAAPELAVAATAP